MTYPSFSRYIFQKTAFFMFYNTFFVKLFKYSEFFSYFCNVYCFKIRKDT